MAEGVEQDGGARQNDGDIPPLSAEQMRVLEDLRVVQGKHKSLTKEYEAEWNKLKHKYEQQYFPLYAERRAKLQTVCQDSHPVTPEFDGALLGTPGVPNFWLVALLRNRALKDLIEQHDRPILSYCKDITYEWHDPTLQDGFHLTFTFAKNPYFSQETLTKDYNMSIPPGEDEAVLVSTASTPITWAEGMNVTKKTISRKQRNKKTKQIRTILETVDNASFFNFFSNYVVPTEEKIVAMSESEVVELELTIEADYEVGVLIRERIIPQALLWFCNEVEEESEPEDEEEQEDVDYNDVTDSEDEAED